MISAYFDTLIVCGPVVVYHARALTHPLARARFTHSPAPVLHTTRACPPRGAPSHVPPTRSSSLRPRAPPPPSASPTPSAAQGLRTSRRHAWSSLIPHECPMSGGGSVWPSHRRPDSPLKI
eukprot:scaffold22805_cov59-Phaeocystis_antarctica.AAC.5